MDEAAKVPQSTMLRADEAYQRMTNIAEIGCTRCILIGGEPTLHPSFASLFAFGKHQLGLEMRFVTNGRAFSNTKFCDKLIAAGLRSGDFTFSMHAPSDEMSEVLTGDKRAFAQFHAGLRNLLDRDVVPNINIVLGKPLLPFVEQMMLFLKQLGLKKVAFNLASPAVTDSGASAGHCIEPDQLARKSYQLFEFGRSIDLKTNFLFLVPFCLLPYEEMSRLVKAGAISSGCQISSGSGILFNKNGDLIPCNHTADKVTLPKAEIQKIFDEKKFDEFWNSEHMQSLRKTTSVYRSEHCKTCSWYDMCGGGCSLFWTHFNPKDYIRGVKKSEQEVQYA
jgi:radical SAM protein with 4Fe4S-binding SPASM domain